MRASAAEGTSAHARAAPARRVDFGRALPVDSQSSPPADFLLAFFRTDFFLLVPLSQSSSPTVHLFMPPRQGGE